MEVQWFETIAARYICIKRLQNHCSLNASFGKYVKWVNTFIKNTVILPCLLEPQEEVNDLYLRWILLLSNILSHNDIFPIATLFGLELYFKKHKSRWFPSGHFPPYVIICKLAIKGQCCKDNFGTSDNTMWNFFHAIIL